MRDDLCIDKKWRWTKGTGIKRELQAWSYKDHPTVILYIPVQPVELSVRQVRVLWRTLGKWLETHPRFNKKVSKHEQVARRFLENKAGVHQMTLDIEVKQLTELLEKEFPDA